MWWEILKVGLETAGIWLVLVAIFSWYAMYEFANGITAGIMIIVSTAGCTVYFAVSVKYIIWP